MAVENETVLMKFLEELKESNRGVEAEVKETNRKLEKFIETTQKDLTDIKVNQARLEGKIDTLQVEVLNTKEDVKEIKAELKEVKTELKETKNDVSGLYKWIIGTLVVAAVGSANIFLKFFDLLPKA